MRMPGKSLFSPASPKIPALAPLPTREDPAIAAAKEKRRLAEGRRKGIAGSNVTGGLGVPGDAPVSRPKLGG